MNERVDMSSPEKGGICFYTNREEGKKKGGMKIRLQIGKRQRSNL